MAASLTTLFNLALREIGSRAQVALPTERSREAEACNFYYPMARDFIFAAAPWTCARRIKRLARVAEQTEVWKELGPDPGFLYAYALPQDLIHPYYLEGFAPFQLRVVPFPTGSVKCLMTNEAEPILHYIFRNEDPSLWDPQLFLAMGVGLGANICLDITGKLARYDRLINRANSIIAEARATNANIETTEFQSIAPWHAARGLSITTETSFIYPYGPLLGNSNGGTDVA